MYHVNFCEIFQRMLPGRRLRRLTSAQRLASAAATGMPPDESIDRAVSDPEGNPLT